MGDGIASRGKIDAERAVGAGKPAIVEPLSVTGAVMPLLVWDCEEAGAGKGDMGCGRAGAGVMTLAGIEGIGGSGSSNSAGRSGSKVGNSKAGRAAGAGGLLGSAAGAD